MKILVGAWPLIGVIPLKEGSVGLSWSEYILVGIVLSTFDGVNELLALGDCYSPFFDSLVSIGDRGFEDVRHDVVG